MQGPRSRPPIRELRHRRLLCFVIALAVAVRIGSAVYQGNEVRPLPGTADQVSYQELAVRVLGGHGFSFGTNWWPATAANQPTAHWSYLYVVFLVAVYYAFGPVPLAARLIQAILTGILQPLLTWRIGRRLFGERVGLVAAVLSSFYAYFVFYSGALMTESFHIVSILWALDIATAMLMLPSGDPDRERLKPWALLGIALGVAALLRQVILLIAPVILAWPAWQLFKGRLARNPSLRASMVYTSGRVLLAVVFFSACLLPWTIRNYGAFGRFVLLNTNAGFAFFWGNHPIHGTSFIPILPAEGPGYGALIPDELRGLNEAEMDRALLERGLGFAAEDPVRYLRLSVSRIKEYFKFWPSANSSRLSNYARVLSFGLCFPFILSGVILGLRPMFRRKPGKRQRNPGAKLVMVVAALYSLVHLLTWTLVRYRLPVDAMLMPFAALSLLFIYDHLQPVAGAEHAPLQQAGE